MAIRDMDSADVIASMQNVLNTFRLPAVQVAEIAGDVITVRCPPEWAAAQRGKHLRRAQEVSSAHCSCVCHEWKSQIPGRARRHDYNLPPRSEGFEVRFRY